MMMMMMMMMMKKKQTLRPAALVVLIALVTLSTASGHSLKSSLSLQDAKSRGDMVTVYQTDKRVGAAYRKGRIAVSVKLEGVTTDSRLTLSFGEQYVCTKSEDAKNGVIDFRGIEFSVFAFDQTVDRLKLKMEIIDDGYIRNPILATRVVRLTEGMGSTKVPFVWDRTWPLSNKNCHATVTWRYTPEKQQVSGALAFTDATREWQKLHAQWAKDRKDSKQVSRFGDTHLAKAKKYAYLMVGGLFTHVYPGYMQDPKSFMKSVGLTLHESEIDTFLAPTTNAKKLAQEVKALHKKTGRKVILGGHSKGCVDIHHLLGEHPEVKDMVAGVILLMGPVWGTPLIGMKSATGKVAPLVTWLGRGDQRAVSSMSIESRVKFRQQHPWPRDLPTVTLGAWQPFTLDTWSQALKRIRAKAMGEDIQKHFGFHSDGMVTRISTVVPGAKAVFLNDAEHGAPAFTSSGKYPAREIWHNTLVMLLDSLK